MDKGQSSGAAHAAAGISLRLGAIVALLLAVFMLGVYAWYSNLFVPYNLKSYRGDGAITDSGFFSYPRYRIVLPSLSLDRGVERNYALSNLPPTPLWISFRVMDANGAMAYEDREVVERLKDLPIQLSCKLSDDAGRAVCDMTPPMRDWHFDLSPSALNLWAGAVRDLELKHNRRYRLEVQVKGEQNDQTGYRLEPRIEGGGHELP